MRLQLIWDNCKLYNIKGSYIYKVCEKMERYYNKELAKFRSKLSLEKKATVDEVTSDMKKELCSRIRKMTPELLTKFAAKVSEVQHSSVVDTEKDTVQIRMDDWS